MYIYLRIYLKHIDTTKEMFEAFCIYGPKAKIQTLKTHFLLKGKGVCPNSPNGTNKIELD